MGALYLLSYTGLVGVKGVEPLAFPVSEGRSNQLSYTPLAPRGGIEPPTRRVTTACSTN